MIYSRPPSSCFLFAATGASALAVVCFTPRANALSLSDEGSEPPAPGGGENSFTNVIEAGDRSSRCRLRTDESTGLPARNVVNGKAGTFFFAGENIDNAPGRVTPGSKPGTLRWTGIDISGFDDLTSPGDFAADEKMNRDRGHAVRIDAAIDAGGFTPVLPSSDSSEDDGSLTLDAGFEGERTGRPRLAQPAPWASKPSRGLGRARACA